MTQTCPAGTVMSKFCRAGQVTGLEVGLVDLDVVDRQLAVRRAAHHVVAGQADDPLDQVVLGLGGQQADEHQPVVDRPGDGRCARRAAPASSQPPGSWKTTTSPCLRSTGPGVSLRDDDAVVDDEGVLHRPRRDEEGLQQPGLDDERQHQRHDDDDDDLADGSRERCRGGPARRRVVGRPVERPPASLCRRAIGCATSGPRDLGHGVDLGGGLAPRQRAAPCRTGSAARSAARRCRRRRHAARSSRRGR